MRPPDRPRCTLGGLERLLPTSDRCRHLLANRLSVNRAPFAFLLEPLQRHVIGSGPKTFDELALSTRGCGMSPKVPLHEEPPKPVPHSRIGFAVVPLREEFVDYIRP